MKITTTLSLAFLLLCACGSSDTGVTGRYELEQESFAEALADKMIELGKLPEQHREQAVQQLRSTTFSLDLAADGTFTAAQAVQQDHRTYKGTWSMVGTHIRLDQTHENGKELADELTGTLVGGTMSLTQKDQDTGGEFTMTLHHQSVAAPR